MIGGNVNGTFEIKTTVKNSIGESESTWVPIQTLRGFLDYSSGDSRFQTYYTKSPEYTHVFISDYVPIDSRITVENSRFVVNGKIFDIELIDNPMELNEHLEIMLNYVGVFNG